MQVLQHSDGEMSSLQRSNALGSGTGGSSSCERGDAVSDGRAADCLLVKPGILPLRRVDDQLYAVALDEIDYVGASFFHLVHAFHGQSRGLEDVGSPVRRDQVE